MGGDESKTVIVAYSARSSGISSYTLELSKLVARFSDTFLLSFDDISGDFEFETVKLNVMNMPRYLPLFSSLLASKEVGRVARSIEPNLVHETLPPLAFRTGNYVTTRWSHDGYLKLGWIRSSQMPFPENLAGIPVTLQHFVGDIISLAYANRFVDVSVDSQYFIPPPVQERPIKAFSEGDPLNIIFISRDLEIKRKNLETLLIALRFVNRNFVLHLVGSGQVVPTPYKLILHGQLSRGELIELLKEMDVMVLPSTYEELGYVGLEAYSVGLPVIASDIAPFRTLFRESRFFSPLDFKKLAELLSSIQVDELKEMGRRSHRLISLYNKIAERKLRELYKQVDAIH